MMWHRHPKSTNHRNVTARHGRPTRPADRLDFPQNPGANSRFQGAAAPAPPLAFTPGATRESTWPRARAGVDAASPDRSLARRDARGARARPSGCGGAAGRADFPKLPRFRPGRGRARDKHGGVASPRERKDRRPAGPLSRLARGGRPPRANPCRWQRFGRREPSAGTGNGAAKPLPPATAWGRLTTPSAPARQQKRGEPVSFCITGAFSGGRTSRETRGRRPAVERGETLTLTDLGGCPAYFATFATP